MLRRKRPSQRGQLTYRQINRLLPFTGAPLFHALQLLATGDSAHNETFVFYSNWDFAISILSRK